MKYIDFCTEFACFFSMFLDSFRMKKKRDHIKKISIPKYTNNRYFFTFTFTPSCGSTFFTSINQRTNSIYQLLSQFWSKVIYFLMNKIFIFVNCLNLRCGCLMLYDKQTKKGNMSTSPLKIIVKIHSGQIFFVICQIRTRNKTETLLPF